jgi:hypothetical protein
MTPGTVFVNQTILRAHSKFIGVFRILIPQGEWTLMIGVNEQGVGCLLKLDVVSI